MATVSKHRLVGGIFLLGIALTGCVSQSRYDALEAQNAEGKTTIEGTATVRLS